MTVLLSAADVQRALDMTEAIDAMEALCREEAAGRILSADRIHAVHPFDLETGTPLAVMDGNYVTAIRTGAIALHGDWLQRGQHVNSIGSTAPEQREIHPSVWQAADRIVLDTHRLLHESGDAIAAREAGLLDESRMMAMRAAPVAAT